jgi:glucose/arabinose dehydrogenase
MLLIAAAAVAVALGPGAGSAGAVKLVEVGAFEQPTYVAAPAGDHKRLFVVEREGVIRVMKKGRTRGRPFLDISQQVSTDGERGLLSIAFHPGYAKNRLLYAYYTDRGGDIRIDEFRRRANDRERAIPASQRHVLRIEHSALSNHNGGQLQFGPDGLLYAGPGDGGGGNDPTNNAQNRDRLLGKLLRIDPRGDPYRIPPNNPFVGPTPGAPEVFAYGLRNPYRFSFDRTTGALVIADVGQNLIEEVDYGTIADLAGANFGWRCFEGSRRTPGVIPPCSPTDHERPIFEYEHGPGCSITGGYVVRDRRLGGLFGRYIFGDLCDPRIRSIKVPSGAGGRDTGLEVPQLVSFGQDAGGCLYAVSIEGPVSKLVPNRSSNRKPC